VHTDYGVQKVTELLVSCMVGEAHSAEQKVKRAATTRCNALLNKAVPSRDTLKCNRSMPNTFDWDTRTCIAHKDYIFKWDVPICPYTTA